MLIIWSAVTLGLITLCVPETYHPVLLRHKAAKLRKETGDDRWKAPIEVMQRSILQTILRSCYRPFLLLTLERELSFPTHIYPFHIFWALKTFSTS